MDDLFRTLTLSNGTSSAHCKAYSRWIFWRAAHACPVIRKFICKFDQKNFAICAVSGDALGTAMDILGSDWGNSSDWSGSQEHEHQHNISPFMEPDRDKSGFSPVPNLASVSEQTNITMTGGSTMTGSSGFGQGSSRQNQESACCSPVSLDMPMARQQAVQPQPLQHPVANDDQDDAASEFSRSSSSNWSHNDHSQRTVEGSNRLQLSDLIGRGAFGSVYRGLWKGRQAAIKVSNQLQLPKTCSFRTLVPKCQIHSSSIEFISVAQTDSTSCHCLQVVEHDNGLLGECDELDVLASGMDTRSPLDTAGSSMNGNAAVMLEAALSSAVMHQNVVQTYDYQTRSSSLSGGQVRVAMCRSGISVQALWQRSLEAVRRRMRTHHSIAVL